MEEDKEHHIDDNEKEDSEDESEIQSLVEDKTQISIDNNPDKKFKPAEFKKTVKKNPWVIATIVLGIIALVLLVLMLRGGITGNIITGRVIGEGDIGSKTVDFVNTNLLPPGQGQVTFNSISEKSGLYEVLVNFQGREVPIYVTKDGEFMAQTLIPMNELNQTQEQTQPPVDVPKSDKPKVELFVMSFCPYGNRAEDTMLPVYELLGDKVDWNINYIVSVSGDTISSLHGQPETDQNIREVCVKNEYGLDKFWDFISYVNNNCGRDGGCWEEGANKLGIDTNKIQSCFDTEGIDLMKKEAQISGDAGARGSPTLLINGVKSDSVYQYENPEAYKQAICSAFNEAPEECNEILEGSSAGASAGGSC